eukprot:6492698-Amphidinium_carterae.1
MTLGLDDDMPCLLLPKTFAGLVLAGKMTEIFLLDRWVNAEARGVAKKGGKRRAYLFANNKPLPRPFGEWPPVSWENAALPEHDALLCGSRASAENCFRTDSRSMLLLARELRDLASSTPNEDRFADDDEVTRHEEVIARFVREGCNNHACIEGRAGNLVRPLHVQRHLFSAMEIIQCLRFAHKLRGGKANVGAVMNLGVQALLPSSVAKDWVDMIQTSAPSASTLGRAELALDATLCSMSRKRHVSSISQVVRFGFADSSPQASHDWLLSEHRAVSVELLPSLLSNLSRPALCMQLISVAHWTIRYLMCVPGSIVRITFALDAAETAAEIPLDVKALLKEMSAGMSTHVHVPVSVTSGQRALVHKVTALAWSFFLDAGLEFFPQYLSTFRSFTTDMGVELGISDFRLSNGAASLLPDYLLNATAFEDDPDVLIITQPMQGQLGSHNAHTATWRDMSVCEESAEEAFLPKALTLPGIQHIIHNLLASAHSQLTWWDEFYGRLKNCERFLHLQENRDRFAATCLQHRPGFHQHIHVMKRWSHTLYEKRWHEVVEYLREFVHILPVLQLGWNRDRFTNYVDTAATRTSEGDGDEVLGLLFDADMLSETLQNMLFAAYAHALLAIDGLLEELGTWCSFCVCHRTMCKNMSLYARGCVMETHYGQRTCPLAGCVAPEMASGEYQRVLSSLWQQNVVSTFSASSIVTSLTETDLQTIQSDMLQLKTQISLGLQTKLQFFHELPWSLAACASMDEEVAKECVQKAIRDFETCPDGTQHHRRTLELLSAASPIRKELDRFVSGARRHELSPACLSVMAEFRCMPVVETTIEGRHARIALRKATPMGPVLVSMENRYRMLEQRLRKRPEDACCIMHGMFLLSQLRSVCVTLHTCFCAELPSSARNTWQKLNDV